MPANRPTTFRSTEGSLNIKNLSAELRTASLKYVGRSEDGSVGLFIWERVCVSVCVCVGPCCECGANLRHVSVWVGCFAKSVCVCVWLCPSSLEHICPNIKM